MEHTDDRTRSSPREKQKKEAMNAPPSSIGDYLEATSQAARNCYLAIQSCWQSYEEAQAFHPMEEAFIKDNNGTLSSRPIQSELERVNLSRSLRFYRRGYEQDLSLSIHDGGILQLAATAIFIFSKNDVIPSDCEDLLEGIKIPTGVRNFPIGKREKGIPEGLLIYVGRNQYAHWEDTKLHPISERVFEVLNAWYNENSTMDDLAFSRGSTQKKIFADNFLFKELNWKNYGDYVIGMRRLLEPFDRLRNVSPKKNPKTVFLDDDIT